MDTFNVFKVAWGIHSEFYCTSFPFLLCPQPFIFTWKTSWSREAFHSSAWKSSLSSFSWFTWSKFMKHWLQPAWSITFSKLPLRSEQLISREFRWLYIFLEFLKDVMTYVLVKDCRFGCHFYPPYVWIILNRHAGGEKIGTGQWVPREIHHSLNKRNKPKSQNHKGYFGFQPGVTDRGLLKDHVNSASK